MCCWIISPFNDFAVFDPSPLTLWINCCFLYLYLLFYYQFQYFSFYIFRKSRTVNSNFSSWIVKIFKFYWLTESREPRCITMLNVVEISQQFLRYHDFLIFQDGGHAPSWIVKIVKFYWLTGPQGWDASPCQILLKSVNPLWRFLIFWFFDGGCPPYWICLECIWTTHKSYFFVLIIVQNMVAID